jgi:hypothetical protein
MTTQSRQARLVEVMRAKQMLSLQACRKMKERIPLLHKEHDLLSCYSNVRTSAVGCRADACVLLMPFRYLCLCGACEAAAEAPGGGCGTRKHGMWPGLSHGRAYTCAFLARVRLEPVQPTCSCWMAVGTDLAVREKTLGRASPEMLF